MHPVAMALPIGAHSHWPIPEKIAPTVGTEPRELRLVAVVVGISTGVVFKLNTIWPTKKTTHRFYYYFYEPIV